MLRYGNNLKYRVDAARCFGIMQISGMKIFTAISAMKNYVMVSADAVNEYAHAPPQVEPSYARVDSQAKICTRRDLA